MQQDKREILEQQALRVLLAQGVVVWSTQGGGKPAVQVSQELSWCMQGGLSPPCIHQHQPGGTGYTHKGGAATYLCMPDDPDYLHYQPGVQGYSYVFGVEYQTGDRGAGPLSAVYQHNAPCAVCYASTRAAVTMIPAKTRCPSTWTLEYSGYLMSQGYSQYRTMYECVDKNPYSLPGTVSNTDGATFYHVEANCNGMACPPYDPQKELSCAVCTK